MSTPKGSEFNDFIIYILGALSIGIVTLIGILYRSIWKNIENLWTHKNKHDEEIEDNSKDIVRLETKIDERTKKK